MSSRLNPNDIERVRGIRNNIKEVIGANFDADMHATLMALHIAFDALTAVEVAHVGTMDDPDKYVCDCLRTELGIEQQ